MFDVIRPSRVSFTHMETVQLPVKDCLIKTLKNAVKVLKCVTQNVKRDIWFKVISEIRWHFHLFQQFWSITISALDQHSNSLLQHLRKNKAVGLQRPWFEHPAIRILISCLLLIREIRLLIFWQIIMVNRYNVTPVCTTSA